MNATRRAVLGASAAFSVAAALPRVASAAAPPAGRQVAGAYRTRIGDIEVTALLDGFFDLDRQIFPTAEPAKVDEELGAAFLPTTGPIRIPVNAYLVNDGARLILIDTGTSTLMGPSVGQLPESLAAAGFDPAQVDVVLLTHMHPDHANGLLTPAGEMAFPNVEVMAAEAEAEFWLTPEALSNAPADVKPFFEMAQKALAPYSARTRRFTPGGELVPGITSIAAIGHTPGHTGYRIASGSDQLLIWGDVVHAAALQFARPDWSIAFDVDQAQAATTRKAMLDMVAADRIVIAGMHLPFPGFGHVAREGAGYRFVPAPWLPLG